MAGLQIGEHRTGHTPKVEAEVVIEPLVLDRHEGGRRIGVKLVQIDRRRELAAPHRDQAAGAVQV